MVYGRILYNSIREYTPKFFPTVPYSQTVKPTFGTSAFIQWDNLKSYQNGMLVLLSKQCGEHSEMFGITVGLIRSSCLVFASAFGLLSTSPSFGFINTIIATEPLKQQLLRKEPTRSSWEKRRRQRKQPREQLRRQLEQLEERKSSDT